MSQIATIEQAIIDRLKGAASAGGAWGYDVPCIESYGGELDGDPATALARGADRALWVVFAGEEPLDGRGLRRFRYSVVVYARSYRNERSSRRGDGSSPGAYQMLEDVRGALLYSDLGGVLCANLEHLRTRSLFSGQLKDRKAAIVYAIDLQAWTDEDAGQADPAALADFLHFHVDWDIPPLGEVVPPLPAAEADATDDVYPREEES